LSSEADGQAASDELAPDRLAPNFVERGKTETERAMMSTLFDTTCVTADQLLRMPDDGFRYELVQGELRKMTPAGGLHGRVAMNVGISLGHHVRAGDLGMVFAAETGFRLAADPDTVRAPDAAFVRKDRAEKMSEIEGYLPGAPDLAIEVLSPGDTYSEVHEKALEWLAAGSRMVIILDPRKLTATVYRSRDEIRVLTEDDVLEGANVVPGWRVGVRELFA
jgi:Uma2 family endonuclease